MGADGRPRCPWALAAPDYLSYHDQEWGRAVRDDRGLFERMSLEGFQSGLSWLTILRKRENFRRAFAGFDPALVAAFGPAEVDRLLADTGIVRHRGKIEAVIHNAAVVAAMPAGGLTEAIWSHQPPARRAPRSLADVPASTPASSALARDLRGRGVRFVGPTTAYALMQACGLVDDHLAGCLARGAGGR